MILVTIAFNSRVVNVVDLITIYEFPGTLNGTTNVY